MDIEKLIINTNKYDIELDENLIVVKDMQSGDIVYEQDGTHASIVGGTIEEALELINMVKKIKESLLNEQR